MKSGYIDTNGQQIYYEMHGEGEPLILIMGIGGDSTLWAPYQVPAFSTIFQVIVLNNRDAGRSSKTSLSYTIADMADDVVGLMDGLGVERAHILGISMGGMIAQEFALRYSDRLSKLIMTGTGAATGRAPYRAKT